MTSVSSSFAGIDISKDRLDLCLLPEGHVLSVFPADLGSVMDRLAGRLVVVEPTGGYERPLVSALDAAGIAVAVVNARQIRDFARASGLLAKTDRLDARVLAEYAARMTPAPRPRRDADRERLCALVRRRRQLVEMRKGEMTRRLQAEGTDLAEDIARSITFLADEIATIEKRLQTLIATAFAETERRLRSMPGIGALSVAALLAELPELGHLSRREIAALVGVAPFARDSGAFRGKRCVWGGRAALRQTLYMAAVSASRTNGPLRDTYQKLRQAGKPHKVATTAVIRKMIVQLNAMMKNQTSYGAA